MPKEVQAQAVSELLNGCQLIAMCGLIFKVWKVDALGGVTVYVPKDMKYQDDSQHLYINLKAGQASS